MSGLSKIKLVTTLRFFAESLFFPFISLYFQSIDYSKGQIGILISLIPISAILMNPIYAHFCKNPKITKNALMVMSFLEALFVIGLIFTHQMWLSIILIICISVVSSSNFGLIDSIITLTTDQYEKPYSSVRIYGSISYLIGGFMAGYIAKWTSYPILFSIALSCFMVVSILYYLLPTPQEKKTNSKLISFRKLFSNKAYVFYIFFYMLLAGTLTVGDDFFSLYLTSRGCEDYIYSYVMSGFILVEVISLFLLNHFWQRSGLPLFFVACFFNVIRFILESIPNIPVGVLICAQLTRGITWSIILFVSTLYIKKLLGFKSATKGIMLMTLLVSIYTALFKFFGGSLIEKIGFAWFYTILGVLAGIAMIYFVIYYLVFSKKTTKGMLLNEDMDIQYENSI